MRDDNGGAQRELAALAGSAHDAASELAAAATLTPPPLELSFHDEDEVSTCTQCITVSRCFRGMAPDGSYLPNYFIRSQLTPYDLK